jgi:predicted lysophospholipase L1 biosynthesis ABC-type transport system permease subunit
MKQRNVVRTIYLYLVTVVGIVTALVGLIGAITSVLNMYVFRLITSDSMQNELSTLLEFASAVAVGVPVWLYHWGIIQETRHRAPAPATPAPTVTSETVTVTATPQPEARRDLIRRLYIYLLSAIGLFIVMFNLIGVAPNVYRAFFMSTSPVPTPIKPDASGPASLTNTYAVQSLIRTIVAVVVGTPVWLYHWHLGQREHRDLLGD